MTTLTLQEDSWDYYNNLESSSVRKDVALLSNAATQWQIGKELSSADNVLLLLCKVTCNVTIQQIFTNITLVVSMRFLLMFTHDIAKR